MKRYTPLRPLTTGPQLDNDLNGITRAGFVGVLFTVLLMWILGACGLV